MQLLSWCSKTIQIRTVFVADSFLQFREGDGFRAFLVVEGDHHFVIVQENRIDEGVDEHLAVAFPAPPAAPLWSVSGCPAGWR